MTTGQHPTAGAPTSPCRSCERPVVWCWTRNTKLIPVDPDPDPKGNLRVEHDPKTRRYFAHVDPVAGTLLADEPRYMPHHATCPSADDWRKRPRPRSTR